MHTERIMRRQNIHIHRAGTAIWRFALATLVLSSVGCSSAPERPVEATQGQMYPNQASVKVGQPLPWAQMQSIDGKSISLSPGQKHLLIFFATWCSDSQRALTQLKASALMQQSDVQIVAIGREENAETLAAFQAQQQLTIAMVADPERTLYQQVANRGIPQLVTVGADGQVKQILFGEVPNAIAQLHW
jgi:peroxiredoxin